MKRTSRSLPKLEGEFLSSSQRHSGKLQPFFLPCLRLQSVQSIIHAPKMIRSCESVGTSSVRRQICLRPESCDVRNDRKTSAVILTHFIILLGKLPGSKLVGLVAEEQKPKLLLSFCSSCYIEHLKHLGQVCVVLICPQSSSFLLCFFLVDHAQLSVFLPPAGKEKQQGIRSLQVETSVFVRSLEMITPT